MYCSLLIINFQNLCNCDMAGTVTSVFLRWSCPGSE